MRAHLRFQKLYLRAYDPHPTIHNVTDSQNLNKIACMSGPWLIVVDCSISLSMPDKGQNGARKFMDLQSNFCILGVSQSTFEHFVLLSKIKSFEKKIMKLIRVTYLTPFDR